MLCAARKTWPCWAKRTKYLELPPLKQLCKVTNVAALNIMLCGLGKLANVSYMWHTFMYQQALLTKYTCLNTMTLFEKQDHPSLAT